MFKFSRRAKVIIAFVAVVIAGYAMVKLTQGDGSVPQDFTQSRMQGAIIGQTIVNLSNESKTDLAQVNQLDADHNYAEALAVTSNVVSKSQAIRDQAVALSAQIEQMTKALSGISNFEARQAALESISSRLALINQLINYSGDLMNLMDVLRNRFQGTGGSNAEVQAAVNQINTDVNAINNFNAQAGQAMDRFDSIIGK